MIINRIFISTCVFILFAFTFLQGQQVWVTPTFPLATDPVDIYFDASECSCPLSSYSGDIYAHTGLILEGNPSWQLVIGNWGENALQPKLEPQGGGVFKMELTPSIQDFYGATISQKIEKISMVFRSADGTKQTGDLFIDVFATAELKVLSPKKSSIFSIGDTMHIEAVALGADSINVEFNGQVVGSSLGANLSVDTELIQSGTDNLFIRSYHSGTVLMEVVEVFVRSENQVSPLPNANLKDGVNILDGENSVVIVLTAPESDFIFTVGDFSDWNISDAFQMNATPDGDQFWIEINDLDPGFEYAYQYIADGVQKLADPYSTKVLDPYNDPYIKDITYPNLRAYPTGLTSGILSTFIIESVEYIWENDSYERPKEEELVIYELLIRDFVKDHSYQTVIDSLDYIESLGINVLELMPVMEFEGNSSWGYNTSFHQALDKYYGTENDFKELVDACHARGISVVLDFVINHAYGQNPLVNLYWNEEAGLPAENNPWYNVISPNSVFSFGFDFDHESSYTRKYFKDVLDYWLTEFHVDGYRLDFTKGLTNKPGDGGSYDASRIAILKDYAESIWLNHPQALVILEHFAPNNEEKELADLGMMLWGNINHSFGQVAMGYLSGSDFSYSSYKKRGWNTPKLISYMESHDEERMGYRTSQWGKVNGEYNIKKLEIGLERAKMSSLLFLSVPGPKLIWMFGELGYDISIDNPCRVCEKPILWNYLREESRRSLKDHYSEIISLRNEHEVFHTDDFDVSTFSNVKIVRLRGDENDVISIGNIDVKERTETIDFGKKGTWYEYFSGRVLTTETESVSLKLAAGEFRLYSTTPFKASTLANGEWILTHSMNGGAVKVESNEVIDELMIFDASGRKVFSSEPESNIVEVPVSNWSTGVYFFTVSSASLKPKTIKFIKTP